MKRRCRDEDDEASSQHDASSLSALGVGQPQRSTLVWPSSSHRMEEGAIGQQQQHHHQYQQRSLTSVKHPRTLSSWNNTTFTTNTTSPNPPVVHQHVQLSLLHNPMRIRKSIHDGYQVHAHNKLPKELRLAQQQIHQQQLHQQQQYSGCGSGGLAMAMLEAEDSLMSSAGDVGDDEIPSWLKPRQKQQL